MGFERRKWEKRPEGAGFCEGSGVSIVTRTHIKLRSPSMAKNEVVPSPSQVMEGKIDASSDSPTVELNGLQSGSSLSNLHPPAHKVAGQHFSLSSKHKPHCSTAGNPQKPSHPEPGPSSSTIVGSGSRQFNIPITLQMGMGNP